MMTLAQASAYFDRTPVLDPNTSELLFYGQVEPFEDSKRDASSAFRRVLSVAPGTTMPTHRTLAIFGQTWLLGFGEVDGIEEMHRTKYVIAPAPRRLKCSTLSQYLAGQHAREVIAAPYWSKDLKQLEVSSEQPQMHEVYLPAAVDSYSVLWDAQEAFLVGSCRPTAAGLMSAFSLKLTHLRESATLLTRRYSHSAGEFLVSGATEVPSLRVRWQSLFEYGSEADAKHRPGDVSLVLPDEPLADTSSRISAANQDYQVLSVDRIGGAQVAHVRRA